MSQGSVEVSYFIKIKLSKLIHFYPKRPDVICDERSEDAGDPDGCGTAFAYIYFISFFVIWDGRSFSHVENLPTSKVLVLKLAPVYTNSCHEIRSRHV